MSLTRSSKRSVKARRVRTELTTVTLSTDILRVVYALQAARNSGHHQAVVNLPDWRVEDVDSRAIMGLHGNV